MCKFRVFSLYLFPGSELESAVVLRSAPVGIPGDPVLDIAVFSGGAGPLCFPNTCFQLPASA